MGNNNYEGAMEPEIVDDERENQKTSKGTGIPQIDIGIAGIGFAAHAISQICFYRYKIKELEIKRDALKNKLKSDENTIKTIANIEAQEIEKQSINLENILNVVAKKIKNEHIEKKQIIESMNLLTSAIIDPGSTVEIKQIFHETIKTYSDTLKNIGNEGVASLKSLAETTQKAVEASNKKRSNFSISYSPQKRIGQ